MLELWTGSWRCSRGQKNVRRNERRTQWLLTQGASNEQNEHGVFIRENTWFLHYLWNSRKTTYFVRSSTSFWMNDIHANKGWKWITSHDQPFLEHQTIHTIDHGYKCVIKWLNFIWCQNRQNSQKWRQINLNGTLCRESMIWIDQKSGLLVELFLFLGYLEHL